MQFRNSTLVFSLALFFALTPAVFAQPPLKTAVPDVSQLVVMGDSLSAGVQNFSLLDSQQPHGYASVLARQLRTPLILPLVPYPGAPNVLQLVSLYPVPKVAPAPGTLTASRDNPSQQATDISVPGFTVDDALNLKPSIAQGAPPVQQWAYIVLGIPGLPGNPAPTQMQAAQTLKPTTVIEWLGNNDALVPALLGELGALTPIDQFAAAYGKVLDGLQLTGATLIVANIPDVTEVPFFTSAQELSNETGVPIPDLTKELGIGSSDYLRLSAIPLAEAILSGAQAGPLPGSCPTPTASLTPSPVPCVLSATDAATLRSTINCYNLIIELEARLHGALVVDVHSVVDKIYTTGYTVDDRLLTPFYLGGLFTLDGIHPTDTGYAIIANAFIDAINAKFGTHYERANVLEIFAHDPLERDILPSKAPLPPAPPPPPVLHGCLMGPLLPPFTQAKAPVPH